MKKNLILTAVILCIAVSVSAQNTFNKGDKALNFGLGLGSRFYTGSGYTDKIPPISASFEMGIIDHLFDEKSSLGVGGYVGFTKAKWEYSNDWGYKYSDLIIGVRGALHYQLVKKMDTYTGILIGYDVVTAKEYGTSPGYDYSSSASGLTWSWFAGARYYFTDNIAAMAEVGYGIAYLNIGLALKF